MTAPAPTCPDWPITYPGDCMAMDAVADPLVFEQMAVAYLWNWTGRSYGTCPVAVRPCRSDCDGASTFWGWGPFPNGSAQGRMWGPALVNGQWLNVGCGRCGDECGCEQAGFTALRLPGGIVEISAVLVDGAALPPTGAYRVDNGSLLVRTDGEPWPMCQDMTLPPTEPNTFQVDYIAGAEVPIGGQIAAGALACELAKAATSDSSCQLPRRIQTVARQGVTVSFLDSMDDLDKGRTGIWIIDSWVASVTNPPVPSRVYSVDLPRPRNRVTTWP